MKIDYTLPGVLPEHVAPTSPESPASYAQTFGEQFRRLRSAQKSDWREILHLDAPVRGADALEPPPVPHGLHTADAASTRAWWRTMLQRHSADLAKGEEERWSTPDDDGPLVSRMLNLLRESQQREDQILARTFIEGEA